MRFSNIIIGLLAASTVSAVPVAADTNVGLDLGSLDAASQKLKSFLNVVNHGKGSIEKLLNDAKGKDPRHLKQNIAQDLKAIKDAAAATAPAIKQDLADAPKVVGDTAASLVEDNVHVLDDLISNVEGIVNKLVNSEVQGVSDLLTGHVKLQDVAMGVLKPVETFVGEISAAPGSAAIDIVKGARSTVDKLMQNVDKLAKVGN